MVFTLAAKPSSHLPTSEFRPDSIPPKTTTKKSSTQAKTKAKAKAKSDAADITKSPDMETEPPKATEGKPVNARKRPVIGKSTTQATSDKARGSKQS